jgi:membrane protease YdiL (CAAX protease family)
MPEAFDPNWRRPEEDGEDYALETLMTSAATHELIADAQAERFDPAHATSFDALRGPVRERPKIVRLTTLDILINAATPVLIFLMMLSVVHFLLDVRYMFTEMSDFQLRIAATFFVLGVVALNRLVAREGKEQSVIYILGLVIVVVLFTLGTWRSTGSLARGFMDDVWISLAFNLAVVGGMWWTINRLTQECCVDKASSSGEIGIVQGAMMSYRLAREKAGKLPAKISKERDRLKRKDEPYILTNTLEAHDPVVFEDDAPLTAPPPPKTVAQRLPKTHPGISIFYVSIPVLACFVLGYPVLQNGGPNMVTAGYVFVAVYTLAALALLMLTSLRGLRGYCQERNVRMEPGVGIFWAGLGGFMVALVLLGGLLGPAPGVPSAYDLGFREIDPNARWSNPWDYRPSESSRAARQAQERNPNLSGENDGPDGATSTEGKADESAQQQGDSSQTTKVGEPRASSATQTSGAKSPLMEIMSGSQAARMAVAAIAVVGGLAIALLALYLIARALGNRRGGGTRRFSLLRWLEGLLAGFPVRGVRPLHVKVSRDLATSARYHNPVGKGLPPRDQVRYSYDALCALAYDIGQPKPVDDTPREFLNHFPEQLEPMRESAAELTNLYIIAAYSDLEMEQKVEDRLRKFWKQYEILRAASLR